MSDKPHIDSLTSVRFFAALAVVLYHFNFFIIKNKYINFIIEHGSVGVCFFFILSGFILTYTYNNWFKEEIKLNKYFKFLRARFARIYPVYFFSFVLISPLILHFIWEAPNLVNNWVAATLNPQIILVSWIANLSLTQVYFLSGPILRLWNGPSWSIAVEFFFYAFFPFIILYFSRHLKKQSRMVTAAVVVLLVSIVMLISAITINWYNPEIFFGSNKTEDIKLIVYFFPLFRMPEFIIGCLLGMIYLKRAEGPSDRIAQYLQSERNRNRLLTICILYMAVPILIDGLYHYEPQSLMYNLFSNALLYEVYIVPFALIILSLAYGKNILSPLLEHPILVLLGEASYSLYILHIIPFLIIYFYQKQNNIQISNMVIIVVIVGLILTSVIVYKFLETPARKILRGNIQ